MQSNRETKRPAYWAIGTLGVALVISLSVFLSQKEDELDSHFEVGVEDVSTSNVRRASSSPDSGLEIQSDRELQGTPTLPSDSVGVPIDQTWWSEVFRRVPSSYDALFCIDLSQSQIERIRLSAKECGITAADAFSALTKGDLDEKQSAALLVMLPFLNGPHDELGGIAEKFFTRVLKDSEQGAARKSGWMVALAAAHAIRMSDSELPLDLLAKMIGDQGNSGFVDNHHKTVQALLIEGVSRRGRIASGLKEVALRSLASDPNPELINAALRMFRLNCEGDFLEAVSGLVANGVLSQEIGRRAISFARADYDIGRLYQAASIGGTEGRLNRPYACIGLLGIGSLDAVDSVRQLLHLETAAGREELESALRSMASGQSMSVVAGLASLIIEGYSSDERMELLHLGHEMLEFVYAENVAFEDRQHARQVAITALESAGLTHESGVLLLRVLGEVGTSADIDKIKSLAAARGLKIEAEQAVRNIEMVRGN